MRRRSALLAVAAAVGLLVTAMPSTPAAVPGKFCNDPHPIKGQGSSTQTAVQNSVFIPSYTAACPAAQGTVAYEGTGDIAAVAAARLRRNPFFASDLPLTSAEKAFVENDTSNGLGRISPINHIPVLIDGFAVGYNLSSCGLTQPVRLRAAVLAGIYSGAVTRWNDPLLVQGPNQAGPADNPALAKCGLAIKVAVRDDVAGPTNIFKDYLSKVAPAFVPLKAKEVTNVWPPSLRVTCRGVGEAGMASCVSDPGAIGYVEFKVAAASGIRMAVLENGSGQFVAPAGSGALWPSNCPAAAASAVLPPDPVGAVGVEGFPVPSGTTGDWSQTSLTYSTAGYPLCSFTYELVFQRLLTAYGNTLTIGQMRNLVDFMTTILSDGVQSKLPAYGYAPLPASVLAMARTGVKRIDNS